MTGVDSGRPVVNNDRLNEDGGKENGEESREPFVCVCVCLIRTTCSTIVLAQWGISNCSMSSHLGQGALAALSFHHHSLLYLQTTPSPLGSASGWPARVQGC